MEGPKQSNFWRQIKLPRPYSVKLWGFPQRWKLHHNSEQPLSLQLLKTTIIGLIVMSLASKAKEGKKIIVLLFFFGPIRLCLIKKDSIVILLLPRSALGCSRSLLCYAEWMSCGSFFFMGAKIQKMYSNVYLPLQGSRRNIKTPQPFVHEEAEGVLHVHLISGF